MSAEDNQSTDVTKEQLSDVYTAGTSDGIMKTDQGLIRVTEDGSLDEQLVQEQEDDGSL